jgi:hypothetical protein
LHIRLTQEGAKSAFGQHGHFIVHTGAEEPAGPEKHTTNNLTVSFRHIPYMSLSSDCSFGDMICQSEILPKVGSSGEKPNNVDIQSEYESRKIENRERAILRVR